MVAIFFNNGARGGGAKLVIEPESGKSGAGNQFGQAATLTLEPQQAAIYIYTTNWKLVSP